MKPALVLLAAGDSRRFCGNKLLFEWEGKPLYRHFPDRLEKLEKKSGLLFSRKIVVTQYGEIAEEMGRRGYRIAENKESFLGISHSIRLGLEELLRHGVPAEGISLESGQDRLPPVCFAVCDQPYLSAETVREFLESYERSGLGIGCLSFRGRRGNPCVFGPGYLPELMALSGDTGGRQVMRLHPEDLYLHEIRDGRELEDIDERPVSRL